MATALLANLRAQYPHASIDLAAPSALEGLYQTKPYGVSFIKFTPRDHNSFLQLLSRGRYDHAYSVMDNRYSWTAFALGARWIVGYEKDSFYKNLPLNEQVPLPEEALSLPDLMANLSSPGHRKLRYHKQSWPTPPAKPFNRPAMPFAVLHLGASTSLKFWAPEKWRAIALHLHACGITPVWSAGPGETHLVKQVDPQQQFPNYAGKLNLAQLWNLINEANLLISPDTGIAHIAKHTETPSICLFGPGSAFLAGQSFFFSSTSFYPITHSVSCRDQDVLFRRKLGWVQQCKRSVSQCPHSAKCMALITEDEVIKAINHLVANR